MKRSALISTTLFFLLSTFFSKAQVTIEVNTQQEGTAMSQDLIGAFFEDINYGADGGLYAELVQNRSFEYYPVKGYMKLSPLEAWSLVQEGSAKAEMTIENSQSINSTNTNYLKLSIRNVGTGVGIQNSGFNGISVKKGDRYNFSVYIKRDADFDLPVMVSLRNTDGDNIGNAAITSTSNKWTKYELELECTASFKTATLNLVTTGSGTIYFDMVSLFPQNTFKNRENGLRQDLAQAVADLEPKFLRFPGGCVSHGRGLDNAYRWKETLGDVAERNPNWNLWGYHQTYGLGFYEYFVYCEDIGTMPLPVLPVGISCQFRGREIAPINEMQPWIDDAIDLVEFANGDVSTEWGSVRAKLGHPEPFNLSYICLGNEEDDIPEFRVRFMMIADSLRKYCPEIKIIGTSGTDDTGNYYNTLWEFSRENKLDAVDEHYYNDPDWFLNNVNRYDDFDRKGPKVFIGEYASRGDRLYNAIAEAAYLTGVEKNADVIELTCYAPLFSNENNNQWNPDLIRFDNNNVVKTANYYVQQLYSVNAGDTYLTSTITFDEGYVDKTTPYLGKVGVGSWNSQVQYDDLKVTSNGEIVLDENFESGSNNWDVISGAFSPAGGTYTQSSKAEPALSVCKTVVNENNYTLSIRAMKTGGAEGFLIPFGYQDEKNYYWFNISGWGNTQHAIEKISNGEKSVLFTVSGSIQNNVWYKLRIEVKGNTAKCYLNDKLLFDIPAPAGPITASVTEDIETNDLIFKLVNSGAQTISANLKIAGINIDQEVEVTSLSGEASQRNTLENPDLIAPKLSSIHAKNSFEMALPPYSFHVFRINKKQ